ncbi:MAG: alpha/beta hydrolase [Spirochaetaceae bacterium]
MNAKTIICLHGYGVRSFFWEPILPELRDMFPDVITPDLQMKTIDTLLATTCTAIQEKARLDGVPLVLLGHSLGGIVAALCAQELGPSIVGSVIIIASPYGTRETVPGPFARFLLATGLIPDALVRPRFFSPATPVADQKYVFAQAVPESSAMRQTILQRKWFHTDAFGQPLRQPALVIASTEDRIVPSAESRQFAEVLGATYTEFDARHNVGHDDFVWAPDIAAQVMQHIQSFLGVR